MKQTPMNGMLAGPGASPCSLRIDESINKAFEWPIKSSQLVISDRKWRKKIAIEPNKLTMLIAVVRDMNTHCRMLRATIVSTDDPPRLPKLMHHDTCIFETRKRDKYIVVTICFVLAQFGHYEEK